MRVKVAPERGWTWGWWDRSFKPLKLAWWISGKRKLF